MDPHKNGSKLFVLMNWDKSRDLNIVHYCTLIIPKKLYKVCVESPKILFSNLLVAELKRNEIK